jgi:hypothetical protein
MQKTAIGIPTHGVCMEPKVADLLEGQGKSVGFGFSDFGIRFSDCYPSAPSSGTLWITFARQETGPG